MAKPISFGKLDYKVVSSMQDVRSRLQAELPFRVAVLGDFSGRAKRGRPEPASLRSITPILVDRDTIDGVMMKLGVRISLPVLGRKSPPVEFTFSAMDDFHPDQIFKQVGLFQALRETRDNFSDPKTFALLAGQLERQAQSSMRAGKPSSRKSPTGRGAPGREGLLNQIVDEQQAGREEKAPTPDTHGDQSEWSRFLKEIVSPYITPDVETKQAEMIGAVDAAINELMRIVLHNPDFQEIESAWRALNFILSRLETDSEVKLCLIDISKPELAADIASKDDLASTGIFRLLVEEASGSFGGEPWAALIGNYTFDATRDDAELLGRIAKIARQAGAPFLAAGHPHLVGCESLVKTPDPQGWNFTAGNEAAEARSALRKLPEASYVGLALPRFLLRLPYGRHTDPIDTFDFEEIAGEPKHEEYLWGNPCFACAYLLAQTFSHHGWEMEPAILQDIGDLPLHVYKSDGESIAQPCAEVQLTQRGVEVILERGLMPLISFKDQDIIRLARFQSITDPPTRLAGPWVTDLPADSP